MRTLTFKTASSAAMIIAACAQPCMAQLTHHACWSHYKAQVKQWCCKMSTESDQDACFEEEEADLRECLLQVSATPSDCWAMYTDLLNDCGSGPCGIISEIICDDVAMNMYRWCLGVSWDSIYTSPALRLDTSSNKITLGETYVAIIEVHDPSVTDVTVILVHNDAATRERRVVEVGAATFQAYGSGGSRIWTMDLDLRALPVADDHRISLIARTEIDGRSGDIDLVGFELTPFDFNGDGQWDLFDHLEFNTAWQQGDARADMNRDGIIDLLDVSEFQALSQ